MADFGTELRRRRMSAGISLTAFAATIHFTKGYLSRVETGQKRASHDFARACDRVLKARGELLALVTERSLARRTGGGLVGLPDGGRLFLGREAELAALTTSLRDPRDTRAGVVHGMAGSGKTALAVAAAHAALPAFPDGCLFFDYRGHTPGAEALSPVEGLRRLVSLLDVTPGQVPADQDGLANLVRARLRDRRLLLVLDNVRTADQVRPVLPGAAASRVLVTSRGRLPSLDGSWHLAVGVLPRREAIALWRSAAGDDGPGDSAGDGAGDGAGDEEVVAEIAEHCGRLPLAVRIAAARFVAGGWSAVRLRDRLADEDTRLGALDDGERSVAAAFAVSCAALPEDQRNLFGLLALHPAAAAESASVEALSGLGAGETDRLLDRLHDAHLVVRDEQGYVELHDLMRMFALRRVLPEIAPAAREAAVARLVGHALGTALAADELTEPHRFRPGAGVARPRRLPFADGDGALAWLDAQWPVLADLVAVAADHGLGRPCWQLAFVLRAFFFREKRFEPWIRTHRRALEVADEPGARGLILNSLGMAHVESGEIAEAVRCHRLAQECFAEAHDERGQVDALSSLAWARLYGGEPEAALADLERVLEVYRRTGRIRNVVIALRGIAYAGSALGRHEEAIASAKEANDLAQLPVDRAMSANCRAWTWFRAGHLDDAGRGYTTAAELAEQAGSDHERARALLGLGNVAASGGDRATAARRWAEAAEYRVRLDPVVLGEARARLELLG
ncbi:helix-turn-helix transcriptional regulator [Amycolatopsis sp. PS_44_ISF1]|nr:helix-turn-helix transcriptional regulator [Amycolatopsis sp. PS_44_ISF1]